MRFHLTTGLLLLALGAGPALASELAVVTGTVADYDGRPLAGAEVTLTGVGWRPLTLKTEADGSYRFWGVRPNPGYSITAVRTGYRSVVYDGLTIESSRKRVVRFRLKNPTQREAVLLLSKDPFPYADLARAFVDGLGVPTRSIDLDQESDPAETVRRVAAEKPNVILSAGLLAGKLVRSEVHDIPSILTLISDSRRYDLLAPNNCFLANNPEPRDVIDRVTTLLPKARRIGLIYDAELSELLARDLRAAAEAHGLTVTLRPCYLPIDARRLLEDFDGQIDVLLVPYDPLAVAPGALDAIIGWAHKHRLPLIAPQSDWVDGGAAISYGVPLAELGAQARAMAQMLLAQSQAPADLGLRVPGSPVLAVNAATLADLGLDPAGGSLSGGTAEGGEEPSLLRAVGVAGLAASIVNVTIGGGIFRLPAIVAASLHAQAPLAFVICGVAMGLIVICIAEAGKRVELTGGPYAYVEVAFGPFAGYLAGILVWLLGCFAVAAVATVLADSVAALLPALTGPVVRALLLIATFGLFAAVNIAGVRQGTRLNAIATIAKLLPLLLLVVIGAFAVRPEHLAWTEPVGAGTMARASILLIFAYSGVESALVPSGEIKDVRRTVPRAILIAMLAITGIYLAIQIVAQGVLGGDLATATTPLSDAAGRVLGPWGGTLLLVGSIVSMFGYVSGMTLAVPRCLYAFARDGVLPEVFGRVHERFRTPHVAIAAQSGLVCLLAITSGFERLAILANLVTLLLYAGCCLAAWRLTRRDPAGRSADRLRVGVVAVAACAVIGWMLTSITWPEWRVTFAMLAAASLLYAVTSRSRAASSRAR